MEFILIEGKERKDKGTKYAKQLRKEGFVPCNLHGGDDNREFYAAYNDFQKIIYTPEFVKIDLDIEGKKYQAMVREVQFHPVTDRIMHIDFLELLDGKPVTTEVPIRLTGLARGVQNGGKLVQKLRKLSIKALPKNITEFVEVDVTELRFGKSISVGELSIPDVEILNPASIPVASVIVPRALKAEGVTDEDEDEEGTEEGAEGAVAEAGEAGAEATAEGGEEQNG